MQINLVFLVYLIFNIEASLLIAENSISYWLNVILVIGMKIQHQYDLIVLFYEFLEGKKYSNESFFQCVRI